ncbi:MAG: trypsin-like peptidase domain-containing protein [Peptococcaceae bacterium]|jgi:S1-C subfamily serine protease|nr:trypsin-like peptidase domain-containing protein [Peptococcaceae bacterium]
MERREWDQAEWEKTNRRQGGFAKALLTIGLIILIVAVGFYVVNTFGVDFFLGGGGPSQPEPLQPALQEIAPPAERRPAIPISPEAYGSNLMATDTVRNIVQQCGDSVVRITAEVSRASTGNPFFNDPFFRDFFGPQQPRGGLGSGFLFRHDGYILTNNHVIEGADLIQVYLSSDEDPHDATVIGTAPELDLAVIKIEGEGFPFLSIGDSDEVYVGDWVVAIGNPYGLDHTVTVGVISAMGRPLTIEGTEYQDLLQTDAAINPGNSGGPMLNLRGEVIGINTAINASAQGIGFAIPSRTVLDALDDLEAGVERVKPWVGISMQAMSRDMLQYFGVEGMSTGVIVVEVTPGAPAQKIGILRGDVLLEIDGRKITDTAQVQGLIARHKVGDIVKVLVFRNGEEIEFMVELEERPEQE